VSGLRKVLATNRQARHEYHLLERTEAGIVLEGCEVKSIREGRVNLKEAFVEFVGGQAFLVGCHINPYVNAGYAAPDPLRRRRLLLHKREILRLAGKVQEKGLTVVPLTMVLDGNWIKVEIALVRGKHQHDHRETLRRRVMDREMEQAIKERRGRARE
jgi:SsrA-binding protein